jgi:hypothetical protein
LVRFVYTKPSLYALFVFTRKWEQIKKA